MAWAPSGFGVSGVGRMDGTHVGFSGTKRGMTDNQLTRLHNMLLWLKRESHAGAGIYWLHHGDCVGADQQAHMIARRLSFRVMVHPPKDWTHRAFCDYDYREYELDYLQRDNDIARWSRGALIAAPKTHDEELRSGTWATVRYGLKHGRTVLVIPPHGEEFRYERSVL